MAKLTEEQAQIVANFADHAFEIPGSFEQVAKKVLPDGFFGPNAAEFKRQARQVFRQERGK